MKNRIAIGKIISESVMFIFILLVLVPIIWIFIMSLKSNIEIYNYPFMLPNPPKFSNYTEAWRGASFPKLIVNTLTLALVTITGGTFLCTLSSFALARFRNHKKLQNGFYMFFISGLFLPGFVIFVPLYIIIHKLGFINTYAGLAFPYVAGCVSFNSLVMVGYIRNIPSSFEEAAVIDGCGVWQIIFRIFVPIIQPVLATVLLLHFIGVWNEFPLASIIIHSASKYTVAFAASFFKSLYLNDTAHQAAAIMIVVIPQLIIFIFFQRYVIEGMTAGAIKG
jgi:raffinose/stachyose/melibiose transport system permease protein